MGHGDLLILKVPVHRDFYVHQNTTDKLGKFDNLDVSTHTRRGRFCEPSQVRLELMGLRPTQEADKVVVFLIG